MGVPRECNDDDRPPVEPILAVGIKRHTFRELSAIQLECYFTFKPEASNLQLGEMDVRAPGVLFDIQDGGGDDAKRWMPHQRYLNALEGERIARWQTKPETRAFAEIGNSGKTVSHYHLGPESWVDVPAEPQLLCYNEIATKMNWHTCELAWICANAPLRVSSATIRSMAPSSWPASRCPPWSSGAC